MNHFDKDVQKVKLSSSYPVDVVDGDIPGQSIVHKFGGRIGLGTTYELVSMDAVYQTPQVAGATALRIKAGNANDTAAGSGAREVTLQGLDETGALVEEALATAGASASSTTSATFLRVFRAWVSESGTYTPASAPASHAAAVVYETSGGTAWGTIDATSVPKGQTQIAAYTVPLGKTAFINSFLLTVDGVKSVDFLLMQRRDILETSAPYAAARTVVELYGVTNELRQSPKIPWGPFPALTDLFWLAQGLTTPDVTVDFEIELRDD